jgi:endonuclease G, mitochondrial
MPKADLSKKASLETMLLIGGGPMGGLEAPGHEPTTPAEVFAERNGYNPGFLDGWNIPLPMPVGNRKDDMRELRSGGPGVELRYRNF